jgi:hypothetical protein
MIERRHRDIYIRPSKWKSTIVIAPRPLQTERILVLYKLAKTFGTFEMRVPHHENGVPKKNKGETPAWEFTGIHPEIIGLYCLETLD